MREHLRRSRRAESKRKTQFYAMLGSRSIWHEGWKAVTTHPTLAGWGHFNDDEWELYHTDVDRAEINDLAAEQPDKLRELVNIWFSEAGANGAFPLDDRSAVEILDDASSAADRSARPVRVLPGHGAGQRMAGGQHAQPLVRDRRAGRHPGRWGRGRALRDGLALRRPCAVREGQPAALRQQLRRRRGAEDRRLRGHPDRREPAPVRFVREGGPGADVRDRDAVALPRRHARSARARSRPSWARSRSPARGCTSADTAASRSPTTTRASPRTRSPAARSTGSRSTSAASRTWTSSARPNADVAKNERLTTGTNAEPRRCRWRERAAGVAGATGRELD